MENIIAPREVAPPPALTTSDPFALIDAHIEAIKPAHQEAWRGPVVRDYAPGQLVWMWDHYNTAIVVGRGRDRDSWAIRTTDADGKIGHYDYPSGQLRPAAAPVEFRWSESA